MEEQVAASRGAMPEGMRGRPMEGVVGYPAEVIENYRRAGVWRSETVPRALSSSAARWPERTALVAGGVRMTYAELDSDASRVAHALLRLGLEPRDRVLFQVGNIADAVPLYYGCLKAGLIPVCTLAQHRERELTYIGSLTRARAHVVQPGFRGYDMTGLATRVAAEVPSLRWSITVGDVRVTGMTSLEDLVRETGDEAGALAPPLPEDVAVFQLSGGTTGLPKVIPRLHDEYVCNSRCWARSLSLDEKSVVLHPLPIMHNAGIAAAMQPIHFVGGTFVLSQETDGSALLKTIDDEGVTDLPVVPPTLLMRLLDAGGRANRDLSDLRRLIVGGQHLPVELAERAEAELGLPTLQMFGMAEGMFLRTGDDDPVAVRHHTVGRPISPLDEIHILRPGTEEEVPAGELGELCCRGPYTIRGYYRAAEHNATAFTSDGFYRTGDLARCHVIDGRAHFSIDGRIKDMINRGVEKINAEEVENVLAEFPAVHAVAVVAMPDRELGERPCAYVIPRPGTAPPTLRKFHDFLSGAGLAKFKWPERIEIVDAFPLTNVGKVSKRDLRQDIADKIAAESAESAESAMPSVYSAPSVPAESAGTGEGTSEHD